MVVSKEFRVYFWDRQGSLRTKKSQMMLEVESTHNNQPLERILPDMINDIGLTETAKELGISKATLGYWNLKLGIDVRRVALAPGETLEIKRQT